MAKLYKFEIITPSNIFFDDMVKSIVFETEKGQICILANHMPMLIANKMGTLKIETDKETKYAFVSEGIVEITSNKVSAIIDLAEWVNEIDLEKAKFTIQKAEEELSNPQIDKSMKLELKASIERSKSKLKSANLINNK